MIRVLVGVLVGIVGAYLSRLKDSTYTLTGTPSRGYVAIGPAAVGCCRYAASNVARQGPASVS